MSPAQQRGYFARFSSPSGGSGDWATLTKTTAGFAPRLPVLLKAGYKPKGFMGKIGSGARTR